MLLGVVFHGLIFAPEVSFLSPEANTRIFTLLGESIHTFRMPLFFLLSGFLCSLLSDTLEVRKFFLNRLNRIFIPFVASLLTVGILTNYLFHILKLRIDGFDLLEAIKRSSFMQELGFENFSLVHLWFLYYLAMFILVGPILVFCSRAIVDSFFKSFPKKHFPKNRIFIVILLAVIPTIIFLLTGENGNPAPIRTFEINFYYFSYYFYFYAIGLLLFKLKIELKFFVPKAGFFLLTALLLTITRLYFWSLSEQEYHIPISLSFNLAVWFYIFGFLGIAVRYFEKTSTTLKYLADASYWIYLIHMPITLLLNLIFFEPVSFTTFLLLLCGIFFLSLISYNYLVRPSFIGKLLNGKSQTPYPVFTALISKLQSNKIHIFHTKPKETTIPTRVFLRHKLLRKDKLAP